MCTSEYLSSSVPPLPSQTQQPHDQWETRDIFCKNIPCHALSLQATTAALEDAILEFLKTQLGSVLATLMRSTPRCHPYIALDAGSRRDEVERDQSSCTPTLSLNKRQSETTAANETAHVHTDGTRTWLCTAGRQPDVLQSTALGTDTCSATCRLSMWTICCDHVVFHVNNAANSSCVRSANPLIPAPGNRLILSMFCIKTPRRNSFSASDV